MSVLLYADIFFVRSLQRRMRKKALKNLIKLCFVLISISLFPSNSFSKTLMDKRYLKAFDLQTRLEQRCDLEALDRIARETKFRPDKVLAYAFEDLVEGKLWLKAPGAAFRSGGNWYHLSYECHTSKDAMNVLSFKYKIGKIIPRKDWDKHYLVP